MLESLGSLALTVPWCRGPSPGRHRPGHPRQPRLWRSNAVHCPSTPGSRESSREGPVKERAHRDLIDSVEEAQAVGRLNHRLKTLTHPALLVVDEIGYLPVTRSGAILFFQLVNRRYEHASTVVTSNKGFEQWGEILHDEIMAAALLDRLLHRCHIVNVTRPRPGFENTDRPTRSIQKRMRTPRIMAAFPLRSDPMSTMGLSDGPLRPGIGIVSQFSRKTVFATTTPTTPPPRIPHQKPLP